MALKVLTEDLRSMETVFIAFYYCSHLFISEINLIAAICKYISSHMCSPWCACILCCFFTCHDRCL